MGDNSYMHKNIGNEDLLCLDDNKEDKRPIFQECIYFSLILQCRVLVEQEHRVAHV